VKQSRTDIKEGFIIITLRPNDFNGTEEIPEAGKLITQLKAKPVEMVIKFEWNFSYK
jgi:hypothetical protein